jgi:putative ABC transport system ATP-binding protein
MRRAVARARRLCLHDAPMNSVEPTPPAIEAHGLCKSYPGGIHAVRDVNLTVAGGEMVAIMGRSGSGKSTLLNLIGALDRPDSGRVAVHGRDLSKVRRIARFRREEIGFVFQLHCLLPHLSLLDNVALPLQGVSGATAKAREALARVGLEHRMFHTPTTVSGGERQRAAIARAIVNRPRLLLADEPTGNVDSDTEQVLLALFEELRRELAMTLLIVTHERGVASRADRIVHYSDGSISEIETLTHETERKSAWTLPSAEPA